MHKYSNDQILYSPSDLGRIKDSNATQKDLFVQSPISVGVTFWTLDKMIKSNFYFYPDIDIGINIFNS